VADIRRLEFEYSIPLTDGAVLLGLREGGLIEKLRYRLPWYGLVWEVDVFQGESLGLVIAEIELPHEDKVFEKPDWLGKEVTSDQRYSNATLTKLPFQKWPYTSEQEHLTFGKLKPDAGSVTPIR
jgi:adenylate cyclase